MSVSLRRSWAAVRALLAALVVLGLVAFVSTPSFASSPPPTVTSVAPSAGVAAGGASVTISGSGFTGATAVWFAGTAAAAFTVLSPNEIAATTPAHAPGIADVQVIGPTGTSAISTTDHYSFQGPPSVTSVSPNLGAPAGGTTVTILGSGFVGISAVAFGSVPATSFVVVSSTKITAVAPAEPAGQLDITLTGLYGASSAVASDQYTFEPAPTILTPIGSLVGVIAGGTVTLTGSAFVAISTVTFDGVAGTALSVSPTGTSLTVHAPAHAAGSANVVVSGLYGTSDPVTYTYEATPTVTSLVPTLGAVSAGGTEVTITGTGLADATGLWFGTTFVPVDTSSATTITATSPAHVAGLVDVRVQLGDGMSPIVPADHFTFVVRPVVTSVLASAGPIAGGNTVTIVGTGFVAISAVTFAGENATSFSVVSSTKIIAVVPPGTAGGASVLVSGAGGVSVGPTPGLYKYVGLPTVSAVSLIVGVITGGSVVTITGTNLAGATKVTFGAVAGTSVVVATSGNSLTVKAPAHVAGTVDIRVITPYGTSATGSGDQFTYGPVPIVTSLSNNAGALVGGDTIVISGTGFTGATAVLFGTTPTTSYAVQPDGTIQALVPAHVVGLVDVHVVVGNGTSPISLGDKFTYVGVPAITKVTPAVGALTGGSTVTLTGSAFVGPILIVDVGSVAATGVHIVSSTSLTFVVPAGAASVQDVKVLTIYGTSPVVVADRYTYEAAPAVAAVTPAAGVLGGANLVSITGTNFLGVSKVLFGATASAKVVVVSSTHLTVTVPAHVVGAVDITVAGSYGTSVTSPSDVYTYEPVPAIASISPSAGALGGGSSVTINGSGFLSITRVTFGSTLGTNLVVASPTQLTITVPLHIAGTVDVQVVGAYGVSPVVSADKYIFQATASISGTVTGAGAPVVALGGVQVSAYNSSGIFASSATTSASGAYTLTGLGSGSYTLDFTPADPTYAPEWFGGATSRTASTSIALLTGQAVAGKNAVLTAGAIIEGAVTDPSSDPMTDVGVTAYDTDGTFAGGADTDANGHYAIPGLAVGSYTLHFVPEFGTADAATYAPQWNGDAASRGAATAIAVGLPSAVDDEQLSVGASISGQVTSDGTTGVDLVSVGAYSADGTWIAGATTDANGDYTIGGLAAGTYYVQFVPPTPFAPQWLGGGTFENTSTAIPLTSGPAAVPANAQLSFGASVAGTVTGTGSAPIAGVEVDAYDADGNWVAGAVTDGSGDYVVTGLAAGGFTFDYTPPTDAYASQWWNDVTAEGQATVVSLNADEAIPEQDVSLAASGSISGTVLGSGTSVTTVPNVSVIAYDGNGDAVETVSTDAFGHYALTGLAAGAYTVQFAPNNSPYGPQWWASQPSQASATVITLASGQAITGDNITLVGASISGAVTGTGGVPLAGVRVYLVNAVGSGVAQTTTTSLGTYSVSGIAAGSYTLEFVPPTSAYALQWWGGKPTEASATFIAVTTGVAVTGRNVVLASALASISGFVNNPSGLNVSLGGTSLPGIEVDAFDSTGDFVASTVTDSTNAYSFPNLAAGSYALFASPTRMYGTIFANQWFSGKSTEATATLIALATGQALTGKNLTLGVNSTIGGTVFAPGGTSGVDGVFVTAHNASGAQVAQVTTSDGGQYTLSGLLAGSYTLDFQPDSADSSIYAQQWYSGQVSRATATAIAVGNQVNVVSKNVTLSVAASISGTVSDQVPAPLSGVGVNVIDSAGDFVTGADTDSSGDYTVSNLAPGTYTLEFSPGGELNTPWWYGQSAYGARLVVTVAGGATLTGENVTLSTGASISGTVTTAPNTGPIVGADVEIFDATGNFELDDVQTDNSGNFTATGLPAGTYIIDFVPLGGTGYTAQWWNGQSTEASATQITLGSHQVVTGIDPVLLVASGSISGTVDGAGTPATPLSGADVTVSLPDGTYVNDVFTGPDGKYTIPNLPDGSYELKFDPADGLHAVQWWHGEPSQGAADLITIQSGVAPGRYDAVLALTSASISGTVYGAGDPNVPLTDAVVKVQDADGGFAGQSQTDVNGQYSIEGLAPGTYTIEFTTEDGSYVPMWWDGKTSLGTATPVTLVDSESLAISPVLSTGASISGTVFTSGAPNQVAPFTEVDAYDAQGNFVFETSTNAVGHYAVTGLAPGSYTLDFGTPSPSFAPQWLGGGATEAAATLVAVLGNQQVLTENALLAKAASISGTVVDSTGQKLDGISVLVWRLEGTNYVQEFEAATNGIGIYTLSGLPAGTYKVGFVDYASGDSQINSVYGDDFWNGQPTLGSSTAITLAAGATAAGTNGTLTKIGVLKPLTAHPTPTIAGTARVGSVLTAVPGTWAPAPVVLTYQWLRNGVAIVGATSSTYAPTALDVGDSLSVVVTGHKVGYAPQASSASVSTLAVVTS